MSNTTLIKLPASVLAEKPAERVSDKYIFVPTTKIIDDLAEFGWTPAKAQEARTRNVERQGYQKHIVRFRHADWGLEKAGLGDSIPEIVLTNAHDGFTSFNLMAGIFRLVCTNGMVVSDAVFGTIRIRHFGYNMKEVEKATAKFTKTMPKIISVVESYKKIQLEKVDAMRLAEAAMLLRWPENSPIQPSDLLTVRRRQDEGNSLWSVFNRIQENLFKGGLRGKTITMKRTTTRAIKNINAEVDLNKDLWAVADKFAKVA